MCKGLSWRFSDLIPEGEQKYTTAAELHYLFL